MKVEAVDEKEDSKVSWNVRMLRQTTLATQ